VVVSRSGRQRFRHSSALTVAAVILLIGVVTVASWQPYLLVLLLVPLGVALWSWRAGTDVDPQQLTVRAAFGRRRVAWSQVSALETGPDGRVTAVLTSGGRLGLTAVRAQDLPAVIAAAGHRLSATAGDNADGADGGR
jgi:Bacterial PH domain